MRRLLPKVFALVLGVVWLTSNSSFAQIQVGLPINFYSDTNVSLPLSIDDVSNDTIYAFLFTVSYDPAVFEVTGVEAEGDIAENFALLVNSSTPGVATISGAHFEPLEGSGTLFRINGHFKAAGTTDLVFNSFVFNEGNPVAATRNGKISNTVRISTDDEGILPEEFTLAGNYPNPFNPTTAIQFDLPEAASVRVNIIDMLGRVVMSVPAQDFQAGAGHSIQLDASSIASGTYVYQVIAGGNQQTYTDTSTLTLIK